MTTPIAWIAVIAAAITCIVLMVRLAQRAAGPGPTTSRRPLMPNLDTDQPAAASPDVWSPEALLSGESALGGSLLPPGAQAMTSLPGAMALPPGAELLGAWRSTVGALASETAVLTWPGVALDQAADQLARAADQADFHQAAVSSDPPDRRTLIYRKPGRDMLIRLRRGERSVRVVVMIRYTNAQPD